MKRQKTINVKTENGVDVIKVEVTRRSSCGNFVGWRCKENESRRCYKGRHGSAA